MCIYWKGIGLWSIIHNYGYGIKGLPYMNRVAKLSETTYHFSLDMLETEVNPTVSITDHHSKFTQSAKLKLTRNPNQQK